MIAKITRGAKMSGLLTYLQGEGKANEHTDPHLVAGDPAIMAWHDDNELSRVDALDIAKQLDQPRRVFGTEVMIPNYLRDSDGHEMFDSHGKKVRDPIDPFRDGNVWHCSLSLKASEGELTDEVWGRSPTTSWTTWASPRSPVAAPPGGWPCATGCPRTATTTFTSPRPLSARMAQR